jgi:O-acetyl-ADP-ribose deacetylase
MLPNKFVIHTLGPVYGLNKPEDELLKNCYINSLRVAEENKIDSIAFPAISTGAFGYPLKEAAGISLKTIIDMTGNLNSVKFIRMVYILTKILKYIRKYLKN